MFSFLSIQTRIKGKGCKRKIKETKTDEEVNDDLEAGPCNDTNKRVKVPLYASYTGCIKNNVPFETLEKRFYFFKKNMQR